MRYKGDMKWREDVLVRHEEGRLVGKQRVNIRCLVVLAATPHDDIRGTGLGTHVALVCVVAGCRLFEQTHSCRSHAAEITTSVRRNDTEETGAGFFGKVGLFEHTLRRVDVGKVEGRTGVTGIKYSGESHAGLKWRNPVPPYQCQAYQSVVHDASHLHDPVHLIIHNMAGLPKVDWVDNFVVAVFFVTI